MALSQTLRENDANVSSDLISRLHMAIWSVDTRLNIRENAFAEYMCIFPPRELYVAYILTRITRLSTGKINEIRTRSDFRH